jgi:hypothetical protein
VRAFACFVHTSYLIGVPIFQQPDGKDQGIDFSSVIQRNEVHGYIPQLRENGFAYPLIACELTGVDKALIGWKDPFRDDDGFAAHNLVEDARTIAGESFTETSFSRVRQWT